MSDRWGKRAVVLAALLLGGTGRSDATPPQAGEIVLIGTQNSGPGQGIMAAALDPRTGALTPLGLAAQADRPTWLVRDPARPVVYAVSETGNDGQAQGGVYSFAQPRTDGRLVPLSRVASGGAGPTFLGYAPRDRTLFVAHYGDGRVAVIPVGADGALGEVAAAQQDSGSGPSRRQRSAHAHAAVPDPSGRWVLVPDLGADRVFVYCWDAAHRTLAPASAVALPAGAGPRHLAFSRDGRLAFVVTELTAEVFTFRWDAATGSLRLVSRLALDPPDFTGTHSAAEIVPSADGRFLYVSNRGAQQLQVFAIASGGDLAEVQRIGCGGQTPWSFAIDPAGRWLIVANQGSGNLAVFAVDRRTGRLTATATSLAVAKPVAVLF